MSKQINPADQLGSESGLLISVEPLMSESQFDALSFSDDTPPSPPPADTDSDDTTPGTDQDMNDSDADGTDG